MLSLQHRHILAIQRLQAASMQLFSQCTTRAQFPEFGYSKKGCIPSGGLLQSVPFYFFSPIPMIVQSHVKEMLSKMDLRCGGDFCDALAKACEEMVKKAAWRCKENKRQTVYGCDC